MSLRLLLPQLLLCPYPCNTSETFICATAAALPPAAATRLSLRICCHSSAAHAPAVQPSVTPSLPATAAGLSPQLVPRAVSSHGTCMSAYRHVHPTSETPLKPCVCATLAWVQVACGATSSLCTMVGEQLVSWGKLKASGDNTMVLRSPAASFDSPYDPQTLLDPGKTLTQHNKP